MQDEVRALGRLPELNVPEAFITRHPFPGEVLQALPSLHDQPAQFSSCQLGS